MVLLGGQIALALEEVLAEPADVVLVLVPLVDPVAFLNAVDEVTLVERSRGIYLSGFALRKVVDPVALVE